MAKKLNILVIEDNKRDQELLTHRLEGKFALTFASTLKEGLLAMANFQYDCVLLDLGLMNGRKDRVIHDVSDACGAAAIVILTGDINPSTRDHMLRCGADGFMVKGVDDKTKEDIEFVIFRALEHKEGKSHE